MAFRGHMFCGLGRSTPRGPVLVAEKAWLNGLGTSWPALCGGKARGPLVSGIVFSRDFQAHHPFGPKTTPEPALCLCSVGSVLGLRLALVPIVPVTAVLNVICVLKG